MRRTLEALLGLAAMVGTVVPPPLRAQVPVGDVYVFERTGTGGTSVTAVADENFVSGGGGLTWACEAEEPTLTLTTTYLGRSFRARVRYAFDGGDPSDTEAWILLTNGMAVRAPEDVVRPFTRRALEARSVTVQVTDFQFRRYAYEFGIAGLSEALARLPCWPPGS
jgi:hypothetical protein